jgi:hypothetical protein
MQKESSILVAKIILITNIITFSNRTKCNYDVSLTAIVDDYDVVPTMNDESIADEYQNLNFWRSIIVLNNVNRGGRRVIKYAKV